MGSGLQLRLFHIISKPETVNWERKREGEGKKRKCWLGSGVSSLISLSVPLPFALWNLSFITLSATPVNTPWKDFSIGNCKVLVEVTGGTTRWSQPVAHCVSWVSALVPVSPQYCLAEHHQGLRGERGYTARPIAPLPPRQGIPAAWGNVEL